MDRLQAESLKTNGFDQHRDEDVIVITILVELVNRYFCSVEPSDQISSLMR